MFQRKQLQAHNPGRGLPGWLRVTRMLGQAVYPEVPAGWPNRAVRRAVKQGRDSRLPAEWRQVLATNPGLRAAIQAL